ncbi:hypothetical protein ACM26V_14190 [Salipaludibacillus sp. HK11]|uniref:hypothetical protein n=1 Tax=Salipaludibacillus sp. HK11 TaxID=3394320 RepID=UPI0039FD4AD0
MRRSDLRSLAGGITVATLVLSPFVLFGSEEGKAEENGVEVEEESIEDIEVTEEDVQTYIESEGLFIVSADEYDSLYEFADYEEINSELEQVKEELAENKESLKVAEDEAEEAQEALEAAEDESGSTSSEADTVYQLYLVVGSGMSSGEIANILEDSNIIDDAGDFRQYIDDEDLVMHIRIGNYQLDSSMSVREIAEIIT